MIVLPQSIVISAVFTTPLSPATTNLKGIIFEPTKINKVKWEYTEVF